MGKLIQLELYSTTFRECYTNHANNPLDFKSYKGHHTLLFGDSYLTSIIGPNGSGKSNSMDAISFVLGIKSSHLRSTHLRDLVYRGRVLRTSTINGDGSATTGNGEQNGEDAAGHAERGDPKSAWVKAVYEEDTGRQLEWKRTITNQGASEYRINNKVVTAQQYNEALERENILIKARNFLVFQGDVEAIASQSPADLTRMIEQISGSLEFKAEYEKLKDSMETAAEDLNYHLQKKRGINSEVKQYQLQKEEAENYSKRIEERDRVIMKQVLLKLFKLDKTMEEGQKGAANERKQLKTFRKEIEKFEQRLEQAKAEQAQVTRDIQKVERSIKKKEKDIEEAENGLDPVNEKIRISQSHLLNYTTRIKELEGEKKAQSESVNKLKKDLATIEKAESKWQSEHATQAQREGRELTGQDLQEYNGLKEQANVQASANQIRMQELLRQQRTEDESISSLRGKVENAERLSEQYQRELKVMSDRKVELDTQSKQLSSEVDTKKKEINAATSERTRTGQKYAELDEKLRDVLHKLIEADDGRRQNEKQRRARENMIELKRNYPGVKGRVSELCKPSQKKYEDSISTVLGRHFDAVVVDTEKTAKDCIQYLRDQRLGQNTFIPLDTIQVKPIPANLKSLHRGMRPAIDCIEYDTAYHRAMAYVCGNDVICDDLAIARFVCFEKNLEVKAVTLDGTIIHKGGLMTGGRGLNDKSARRWEDTEVENMRRLADKLRTQIEELPKTNKLAMAEEALQGEFNNLTSRLNYLKEEVRSLDRNINSKKIELEHAKKLLKDLKPGYEAKAKSLEKDKSAIEKLQNAISAVEDHIFAAFCKRLGFKNVRSYEASQFTVAQEASKKKLEFATQKSRLENMLLFEKQQLDSTSRRIEKLDATSKRDQHNIKELETEKEKIGRSLDSLRAEVELLNEQIDAHQKTFDKKRTKTEDERSELSKRQKKVSGVHDNISKFEADVQRASANRYALLRRCKLEDISIPLQDGSNSLDKLPVDDLLQTEDDAMDVDPDPNTGIEPATTANDYGVTIDFGDLNAKEKKRAIDDDEALDNELSESIVNLSNELEKMAPNMKAVERLEGVETRLRETESSYEASRRAAKRTRDDFEDIRDRRLELFTKAFNHIASEIGNVYKELTRSETFPLGGTAYVDMEDSDEPFASGIRYHAMPPLKRFRHMELLSGGEKTMAALALLFAIHSYQPSPFFVLDEVDAALDNANVAKIANYIRDHSGPGMQFVVISLKTTLFEKSEALVGIYRDQVANSSRAVTLDVSSLNNCLDHITNQVFLATRIPISVSKVLFLLGMRFNLVLGVFALIWLVDDLCFDLLS
jgi:structural maintenance of chromosome 1